MTLNNCSVSNSVMDYSSSIKLSITSPVTALCFDPSRKEVITGFEDGGIVYWDVIVGRKVKSLSIHTSWITSIYYWEKTKSVITMSHEGIIAFWQGLLLIDWYNLYRAVYTCLVVDNLKEFVCGTGDGLLIIPINKHRSSGKFLNVYEKKQLQGHTDVVRCLVSFENRVFSGGFDGQIIIYDTCGKLDPTTRILLRIPRAHDGIISCLVKANSTYDYQKLVISGSFDRLVKIWNDEGQLMYTVENLNDIVISIAHIPTTDTFWVTSGGFQARIFDIYTGENVTEYVNTFMNLEKQPYQLRLITFCADLNMIVGSTSRHYLIIWKYNSESSVLTLKTESGVQCLCASYKPPFSIFSSGSDDRLCRWERKGQTHFSYVQHEEIIHESCDEKLSEWLQGKLRTQAVQTKDIEKLKSSLPRTLLSNKSNIYSPKRSTTAHTYHRNTSPVKIKAKQNTVVMTNCQSAIIRDTKDIVLNKARARNFLRMIYVDELDFVVAACEDGVVYVLGYDLKSTKKFLTDASCNDENISKANYKTFSKMNLQSNVTGDFKEIILSSPKLLKVFNKLTGTSEQIETTNINDYTNEELSPEIYIQSNPLITMAEDKQTLESVSRHIFGMKCRFVLVGHNDSVTCLLSVNYKMDPIHQFILLTSGWDRCICIWDLKSGELIDKFQETQCPTQKDSHKAAKGAVLDMAYNPELDIFAYACSDWFIYVRKFSVNGNKMDLQTKLIGHNGPVNCVVYNPSNFESGNQSEWITGSDDCTIRIWKTTKEEEMCRLTLNANGPITCLCLDLKRNILLAGVDKEIKIYDPLTGHVYRNYKGHEDIIRSIAILLEEDEYVSASADGQIRIWNAWKGNRNSLPISLTDQESVLAAAKQAAAKLSLNPAASLGAAARAFSKAGRFRCIVECLMRHQHAK
ncbi:Vegetative incompatibility protein [Schistosoma japonicum]|uniref:Vegetative incompatibility protein n=1 Tax=Schistosoma japonicum TaxID=6182 RepID=A0A4Z2DR41_SCHJA|nr:Vegetative incompatibility protein [Schistosoma japonicum]